MLKRCSEAKDISDWNEWRENNPEIKIELQGTEFYKAYLVGVNLRDAHLEDADLSYAHLEGANLNGAHFEEAVLQGVHFESIIEKNLYTKLMATHFEGAELFGAFFNNVDLSKVHFEELLAGGNTSLICTSFIKSYIRNTNFKNADMMGACLTKANFGDVNFQDADLSHAILEETNIHGMEFKTKLNGANFTGAAVNAKTRIQNCDIDEKTNFTMVGLDSAGIEPSLLSALKTNIRRIAWDKYYDEQWKSLWGRIKIAPIRLFWWLSDYGSSSERIFLSILISILLFTNAYLIIGTYAPNVFSMPNQKPTTSEIIPITASYIRILCFVISTMVTLGFGGINVTIDKTFQGWSNFAFILVTLNLILGYLFLSVLVTRFGILFQSQAPEQKAKETNNTILYFVALILFVLGSYMLFCWEDIIGFINYAALITVLFGMGYFHFK